MILIKENKIEMIQVMHRFLFFDLKFKKVKEIDGAEQKKIRDLMEVRIKPNCISFIYKQYGKKMQQPITLYKNEDSKLVNFYPYGELISLLNEIEAKKSLKEKRW
jgi:hypothetical protein